MLLAPFIARIRKGIWVLVLVGAVLGDLPDLIARLGPLLAPGSGDLYESAHRGPIRDVLQYIPMCALHFGVDSLTHDADRQWNGWNVRIWVQAILWLVNIGVIVWFVRIWRRNRGAQQSVLNGLGPDRNGE